jgi:iron complex outermembrane receptor protein
VQYQNVHNEFVLIDEHSSAIAGAKLKMRGCIYRSSAFFLALSGLLVGASPGSRAQTLDATQPTTELTEVVVTAQRRAERLQDVPLSVTAITGEDIAARGVTSLEDLQYSVPGLSIDNLQPGTDYVQVRGISTFVGKTGVGEYLDEMPITEDTNGEHINVRLLDMQDVEVLRGPQATLYGEGSMGGTIHFVTTSPDLASYSGSFEAEGGHITGGADSGKADAVLNLPLISQALGLRVVAGFERDGGWIDNAVTGQANVNGVSTSTFRAKLLAVPVDNLELSVLTLYQDANQNYAGFGINGVSDAAVPTYSHDRYTLINGIAKYGFDGVSVVNSIGYINHSLSFQYDLTPTYLPVLLAPPPDGAGLAPGVITSVGGPEAEPDRIFTEELRFASDGQGVYSWTGGVYYRHAVARNDSSSTTAPGSFVDLTGVNIEAFAIDTTSNAVAVYAEGGYKPVSSLTATAGLRYYRDDEEFGASNTSLGPAILTPTESATFHSINPRFNLKYEFSADSMAYLNAAKGFRSGGFNPIYAPGVSVPTTFSPDSLWTYEFGTKQELLDRKLALDGSVYYTDWTDVQSAFYLPGNPVPATVSGGKVTGWGTDISAIARPLEGLTLTGTYSWNNLENRVKTADFLPGDPTDFAVRRSYSASLAYRRTLVGETAGFLRLDYQHSGPAQITLRSLGETTPFPVRNTTNIRTGLDFGRVEISVFATNLFNERTPIFIASAAAPSEIFFENLEQRPRTVGVNFKAHF